VSPAWTRRTAIASVLVVAAVAAVVSYAHMQSLAADHGERWRSYLIPLSVDGMLVASTLAIVDRRRAGLSAGWVPWFGLSLGILASLAANVAAARPDGIARVIAAWPPVAFAVAVETLVIVLRGTAKGVQSMPTLPEPVIRAQEPEVIAQRKSPPPSKPKRITPTPDKTSAETKARALVAENPTIGRRALAQRTGVSEYVARTLLAEVPRNGAKVLEDAK
jgi:hypothetical protein